MYLIIIGAPRSGTNMLRDVLTALPGFATWPCDEINYIWRHGNVAFPSDAFGPEQATAKTSRYIRRQFMKMQAASAAEVLVEKTCANALRVPFVDAVLPEARYVHIYRNGLDVVESAKKRWKAGLDISYLMRKARYVPAIDLPYYATRYAANRIYRFMSGSRRLAFWGPQLENMQALLTEYSLEQICALQWRACVERAEAAFANMASEKVVHVSYEDFVIRPHEETRRITAHFSLSSTDSAIEHAVRPVSSTRVGGGSKALTPRQIDTLVPLISRTLESHGYALP